MTDIIHFNVRRVTENELQAYADGQLNPARQGAVLAYLAANPREAARIAAYRAQNRALRSLYSDLAGPPPPSFTALGRQLRREFAPRKSRHVTRCLVAGGVALGLACAAGWWGLQAELTAAPPNLPASGGKAGFSCRALQDAPTAAKASGGFDLADMICRSVRLALQRAALEARLADFGLRYQGNAVAKAGSRDTMRLSYRDKHGRPFAVVVGWDRAVATSKPAATSLEPPSLFSSAADGSTSIYPEPMDSNQLLRIAGTVGIGLDRPPTGSTGDRPVTGGSDAGANGRPTPAVLQDTGVGVSLTSDDAVKAPRDTENAQPTLASRPGASRPQR
jgi:hypothetical protein